ncbi:MAG: TonB-dependent receptor [Balneolaceae bacterium]|nr:TonB-dependent receptor [Balneolaceae bacterium]
MKKTILRKLGKMSRLLLTGIFIVCLCSNMIYASEYAEAQSLNDVHIKVDMNNAGLDQLIELVENETEFRFVYPASLKEEITSSFSYDEDSISVAELLTQIASQTGLWFRQQSFTIAVNTENVWPQATLNELISPELLLQQTIAGVITDAQSGEPIPGANIIIEGTSAGAITDIDGQYELTVPADLDDVVIVFSFVGFQTQRVPYEGQETIDIAMEQDIGRLDEVIVVGYGTVERTDLTGSVERVTSEQFRSQNMTQITDMLTGTIAGFAANQSATAAGGSSLEVRGPTSLEAGTEPMIVMDGAIYNGSLRDINPNDIETIDILKDASSAAVFGAKAASGVILITTTRGEIGRPIINYSSQVGVSQPTNERRPFGPEEYIQFRADWFRTVFPDRDFHFYTNPDELPSDISVNDWMGMADTPLGDTTDEYLRRLAFFSIEQQNYKRGQTTDWYDVVVRNGVRQNHNISVSGGSDNTRYFWSLGYVNNEGLRVGEDFSALRSRLNVDYQVVDWLSVGLNAQLSDRDEGGVPANWNMYANSPYGQVYTDEEGWLTRLAHGHTFNPLINHYRDDRERRLHTFFGNFYADITLPLNIEYQFSFQPRIEHHRDMWFRSTDPSVGGEPREDQSQAWRERNTQFEWMIDNLITWREDFGVHSFNVTLLQSVEVNNVWNERMENQNFSPGEQLGYHGIQFGDGPTVNSDDLRVTGDALMARLNYSLLDRYLITASVRRDGYSAFGQDQPRATFPALAFAWQIGDESFFDIDWVNQFKLRLSWGINGNRDIGAYSALARLGSRQWYDGSTTRVGLFNATLANPNLRWERTESINVGTDIHLMDNRITLNLDYYNATTTDLLMNRRLPSLTGFDNVTTNLGELQNRGFEMTVRSRNISTSNFNWTSDVMFSLNRNEIVSLFGDMGEYRLLGEDREGELPDFTNRWFIGRGIDAVWDYEFDGIWQEDEAEEAARYGLRPGDIKAVDVNDDGVYRAEDDKQFIGHEEPRYRLGFRNEFAYRNWSASVFIRADLGHIGAEPAALNPGEESNDRRSRHTGPVPYWTPWNPINDYPRLDVLTGAYGGGINVYRDREFVRIQDLSLSYNFSESLANRLQLRDVRIFGSVRNLATFTKWPHWDPETGYTALPRTYTIGINVSI